MTNTRDKARLRVVLLSVALTVGFAFACSRQSGSDGRTAVLLDAVNLGLLGGYALWSRDRALGTLLAAAGVFGWVELLADFLCVRCTGTLDYSPARSALVLASPWWMPFLWTVVAVQVGVVGDAAVRRFGFARGAALTGLLGASLIPLYEQLAWGAHWWRYRPCLQIGHVPVYIVAAEAVIGAGLAGLGYGALRTCSPRAAVFFGAAVGLVTIPGGIIGWGAVEFIGRGARPLWATP